MLTNRLGVQGVRALRARRGWIVFSTVITFVATASAYVFFVLSPSQLATLANMIRSRL